MSTPGRIEQFQITLHSSQIEQGVNGCVALLQRQGLTPQQAIFILNEAAAFMCKQHGVLIVGHATHADTGKDLKTRG